MHLGALLQKVLSELLSGSPLCTAGFDFAPLLSLSLSATGTKWAIAPMPSNQLQTLTLHFLVFIDPWHLIWLRRAQMPPFLSSTLCRPFLKWLTCFPILFCVYFVFSLHFPSGRANKIKPERFPLQGWGHYSRKKSTVSQKIKNM